MSENLSAQLALLPDYLSHHLALTLTALATGLALCLPLGLVITRVKALQWPTLTFASVMQTIPGIALLALMVPLLGQIGFLPALIALFLYSLLPILRNTVTGILEVDKDLTEAARGIGMTSLQSLLRVELPLASPVIIAGIRTATVWVVGAATLSTPVGATSLGNFIFSGLQTQNQAAVLVGCIGAAFLAISLDQLIRLFEVAAVRRSRSLALIAGAALLILIGGGLFPLVRKAISADKRPTVVIGAKTFTEQYILAELMSDLLEDAGFRTEVKSGMGSTVLFDALVDGEVDLYVDYTGTIWANHMRRSDVLAPDSLLALMSEWLASEHDVTCLGALGFNNTYALALPEEKAAKENIVTVNDLAPHSAQMVMGSDYEFFGRPEWESLRDQYSLRFSDLKSMDHSLMYAAVAADEVDVIAAYSTDGHIAAYKLRVLDDPHQALPPYDAALLLSPKAARNGGLVLTLRNLIGAIDGDAMRSANKAVDLDDVVVGEAAKALREEIDRNR
ncbi:MAG: ABC transporter permease/substrate-binding protein [Candidatus Zixiibacteriota bacterium]